MINVNLTFFSLETQKSISEVYFIFKLQKFAFLMSKHKINIMKTMLKSVKKIKLFITLTVVVTLITSCSKDDPITTITATDYTTEVEENLASGTSLGSISALSSTNSDLSYSIESQAPANAVAINSTTGELTVNDVTTFDFETNPELTGVIVINTTDASRTINFTITLLDVVAKKVLLLGADTTSYMYYTDIG